MLSQNVNAGKSAQGKVAENATGKVAENATGKVAENATGKVAENATGKVAENATGNRSLILKFIDVLIFEIDTKIKQIEYELING